jgi:hypothetical protein
MKTIFEIDLIRLAKWHKYCSIAVVTIIVFLVTVIFLNVYNQRVPGLDLITGLFYLATIGVSAILSGFTQRAMGHNVFTSIIWAIACLLLSFLILLSTASTAGMVLKLAGAKTGFLGVSKGDLDRLRAKHCRACGYSRDGIGMLDPCPECTRVPEVI